MKRLEHFQYDTEDILNFIFDVVTHDEIEYIAHSDKDLSVIGNATFSVSDTEIELYEELYKDIVHEMLYDYIEETEDKEDVYLSIAQNYNPKNLALHMKLEELIAKD